MSDVYAYQVGERVRVTIDAEIWEIRPGGEEGVWPALLLQMTSDLGRARQAVPIGWPSVQIERLTPADGEPQPGEIWVDQTGGEWYATGCSELGVVMCAPDGNREIWTFLHQGEATGPIRRVRPAPDEPPAALADALGSVRGGLDG